MSAVLQDAGTLGYLIMLGTVVGVVAAAAFAGLAFTKRRVPLTALVLFPYLVLAAGAFGAIASSAIAASSVGQAAAGQIASLAMTSAWASMAVDWVARWGAALVLAAGTWAAAVGSAVVPGNEPKFTLWPSLLAGLTAVGGALALFGLGVYLGSGAGMALAPLVLVVGLGVAVAATRRAQDDDMFRVAGMRFASSMCALLAVVHGARAVDIGNRMVAFSSTGELMMMRDLPKAVELYDATVLPPITIGLTAMVIGVMIAFHGFFSEIGEVVVRYTVFDAFGVVALLVGVGTFRIVENYSFNGLYTLATNTPALEMYEEFGGDLPTSVMAIGEETVVTRYAEGGFGDLVALNNETWELRYRWTGTNWREVREPMGALTPGHVPLFVIERSAPAAKLVEALEAAPDHKGLLLLRASEAKAGTQVPPELGRLQVTFLPVALSTAETRDLKADLWAEAGSAEVMFGPTAWYGPGDDSLEVIDYAAAALEGTQAKGIHVLAGERKVGDVVNTCMPYVLDQNEVAEGEPPDLQMNAERWCTVGGDEADEVRKEAAAVVEMPNPASPRMTIEMEGPLQDVEVDELVRRELGALAYCAEVLREPPEGSDIQKEELRGRMSLILAVGKNGDVYDTLVEEKSRLQSPGILRCGTKRFRKLKFTVPEEGPVDPAAPPPVRPKVTVHLDF
ncbi:MAG: hypothetical protein KC621_15910 [Myxococcales bacterium]|nr:hypothetical protein [Myxococcales bacterium]